MRHQTVLKTVFTAIAAAASLGAGAIEISLAKPKVTITIPDLSDVQLGPHPNSSTSPQARLLGTAKTGETISVLTPTTDSFTPMRCAGWLTGDVLSRFAPSMDSVQLIKLGENAYVAVFPSFVGGVEQLKAFVASGNGAGHCLQLHISRTAPTSQQREAWLKGFRDVTVKFD